MPIVAIEGPDKCGKSTLIADIKATELKAVFVSLPSFGPDRMSIASALTLRDLELWEALYDRKQLYICDRHVLVSGAVYNCLYNRPPLRSSWLEQHVSVLYLDVPTTVLEYRHRSCNEDVQDASIYGQVKDLYLSILPAFQYRILQPGYTVQQAIVTIKELLYASMR